MEKLFRVSKTNRTTYKGVLQNIAQVYNAISGKQTCAYHKTIRKIRDIDDPDPDIRKKNRLPLKDTLPIVEFNAICKGMHGDNNVERVTGYIVMDIDHLSEDKATAEMMAVDLRDNIFNNPKLGVVLSFISPSGDGVKAVVRVPDVTINTFSQWWDCVAYFIQKSYNIECDVKARNISRLTYMSHDTEAKLSTDTYKVFAYTLDEWQRCLELDTHSTDSKAKQTSVFNTTTLANSEKGKYKQFMREYANLCGKNSIPVFCDYNSWIALGGYIYEIFDGDDEGLRVWEAISSHAPNYNPDDFKSNWKFQATPRHDGFALMGLIVNQTKPHLPSIASWVSLQRNKLMIHD